MAAKDGDEPGGLMAPAELRAALKRAERKPASCVIGLTKNRQAVILLDRLKRPRKLLGVAKGQAKAAGLDLDLTSLRFGRVSVSGKDVAYTVNKAVPPAAQQAMKAPMRAAGHPGFTVNADPSIEDEPEDGADDADLDGAGGGASASADAPAGSMATPTQPAAVPAPGGAAAPGAATGVAAPLRPSSGVPIAPQPGSGPLAEPGRAPGASLPDAALRAQLTPLVKRVSAAVKAGQPGADRLQAAAKAAGTALWSGDLAAAQRGADTLERLLGVPTPVARDVTGTAKATPSAAMAPTCAPTPAGAGRDAPPGADAPKEELAGLVGQIGPAAAADPSRKGLLLKLANDASTRRHAGDLAGTKAGIETLRRALAAPGGQGAPLAGAGGTAAPSAAGPQAPSIGAARDDGSDGLLTQISGKPLLGAAPAGAGAGGTAADPAGERTPAAPPSVAMAAPRSPVPLPAGQGVTEQDVARQLPALLADIKAVKPGDTLGPLHHRIAGLFPGDPLRAGQLHGAVSDLADPAAQSDRERAATAAYIEKNVTAGPTAAGRVLGAAAEGAAQRFGSTSLGLSPEAEQALRQHGVYPPAGGGGTLAQTLNEAIGRPVAAAVDLAARAGSAVVGAYQGGVSQAGEEAGQPQLGRDLAALPEAFPIEAGGGGMRPPRVRTAEAGAPVVPRVEPAVRPAMGRFAAEDGPATPRGTAPPANAGREALPDAGSTRPNERAPQGKDADQLPPSRTPAPASAGSEAGQGARPGEPDGGGLSAGGRPAAPADPEVATGTRTALAEAPVAATGTLASNDRPVAATANGTGSGAGGGTSVGTTSPTVAGGGGTAAPPAGVPGAGRPAVTGGPHPLDPPLAAPPAPRLPTDPHVVVEQRALAKRLGTLPVGSPEALQAADELARASTFTAPPPGRVVLGKWMEDGTGYQDVARRDGGTWYESANGVYDDVKIAAGGSDLAGAVLWQTNQAFLRQQMETRAPRIEFTGMNIRKEAADFAARQLTEPDLVPPARVKEILYLREHGKQFGYVEEGDSFVLRSTNP